MSYEVELIRTIYSQVPGREGLYVTRLDLRLPRAPVAGDTICWHDGWAAESVHSVALAPGRVQAYLKPNTPKVSSELDELLDELPGWDILDNPDVSLRALPGAPA